MGGYNRHFGSKYSHFGEDAKGHDLKVFGDTTGKYLMYDASGNALILDGTTLTATFTEINRAADASARIVNCAATPLAITEAAHDGKIITLNKADGIAVTLPAATGSGTRLKFVVGTSITSSATTIKVTGNDIMAGSAILGLDGGDTVSFFATAADTDTITMDGSTKGGIKGAVIDLVDIAADLWFVEMKSDASGSEATPFSATVT